MSLDTAILRLSMQLHEWDEVLCLVSSWIYRPRFVSVCLGRRNIVVVDYSVLFDMSQAYFVRLRATSRLDQGYAGSNNEDNNVLRCGMTTGSRHVILPYKSSHSLPVIWLHTISAQYSPEVRRIKPEDIHMKYFLGIWTFLFGWNLQRAVRWWRRNHVAK